MQKGIRIAPCVGQRFRLVRLSFQYPEVGRLYYYMYWYKKKIKTIV